uniref:Uncharacterized protein n=1 Tax=Ditylenchus dipsaci TaxID=166011 RepID=A0A915DKI5_9BILA
MCIDIGNFLSAYFKVYSAALSLLKFVTQDFLPKHGLVESEAKRLVNSTYQTLVNRTGDTITDQRFTTATHNLFEDIFKGNTNLANLYMRKVLLPFNKTESVRVDQGKASIVWTGVNLLWGKFNR